MEHDQSSDSILMIISWKTYSDISLKAICILFTTSPKKLNAVKLFFSLISHGKMLIVGVEKFIKLCSGKVWFTS